MFRKQLFDTSRGRIVTLLQRGSTTVDALASELRLTPSAVRSQLTAMERDGVVQRSGTRPGTTRPSRVFELTPEVEQLLSRAYVPLLTHVVDVFTERLSAREVEVLLRKVGRALAKQLTAGTRPVGDMRSRLIAASELLNAELGAVTHVEKNGSYVIQGAGCPLSALTGKHPAVCVAMETLVKEVTGVPVRECCDRSGRPRCCFQVTAESSLR
jgi:predicted ArsR family transcriptional regulator